jgi:hypothetical protein
MIARLKVLTAAFSLTACAHSYDSMTVEQHRAEARRREEFAQEEQEATLPVILDTSDTPIPSWNPTAQHLEAAAANHRKAEEHLQAAAQLEKFENAACRGLTWPQREACPLFIGQVERIDESSSGITLHFRGDIDPKTIFAQMQCHLAFAKARGFDQPSCPLYVNGVSISMSGDKAVVFTGSTPQAVRTLHQQARILFAPSQDLPVSAR